MNTIHMVLLRDTFTDHSTTGVLYLNGQFQCYTLEDRDRHLEAGGEKVPAKTAIPRGLYKVVLSQSARFGRVLPEVLYVPNFRGIRIHAGNTAADTEGCILVGESRDTDFVGQSRVAFQKLFSKLIEVPGTQIVLEVK